MGKFRCRILWNTVTKCIRCASEPEIELLCCVHGCALRCSKTAPNHLHKSQKNKPCVLIWLYLVYGENMATASRINLSSDHVLWNTICSLDASEIGGSCKAALRKSI